MTNVIDAAAKDLLAKSLINLEKALDCDVLAYSGPIANGTERAIMQIVEDLAQQPDKKDKLAVILTTTGGSAMAVERYVNIIRKFYSKVIFIIPDYAFSAGTIFAMSGDEIWMDYFSVLGPIDPQVTNKDGKLIPALGYLDKVNELIAKAENGKLTQAEFLILRDFDLAELRQYEQARELTIDLLKQWLVKYKFKDWNNHKDGREVTHEEKTERAEKIAAKLGDNNIWKSHARPINIGALEKLGLRIIDFSSKDQERQAIRDYFNLQQEYMSKYNWNLFVQTRLKL